MNRPTTPSHDGLRQEGDINLSEQRRAWQDEHLDASARRVLESDAKWFFHQSLSTPCLNALTACRGIYLIDEAGRWIMDFHGNSVHQVGYGHARVIQAVKQQLDTLPFCPRRYANKKANELAERLVALSPMPRGRVLFAPSGTAAIGIALKVVRYATGRYKTISMWGAFHGASLDAISIGGESLFRDGIGPLLPGCFHVPPARAGDRLDDAVAPIERLFQAEEDIAAVIAEPVRCTTVDVPPPGYWPRVRQLCDAHGALLVFDEIPVALGRTGRMFCCEHFDVRPDILVLGKGLGGGVMPMAAVIAREELNVARDRAIGHYTHEKSPLGATAGLATLDVIEQEGLLEAAVVLGDRALCRLKELQADCPLISEVRGLGLCLGVELRREGAKAVEEADQVMYGCLSRGLSFKVSDGNVLTLMPPLIISQQQLDQAIDILRESLGKVVA